MTGTASALPDKATNNQPGYTLAEELLELMHALSIEVCPFMTKPTSRLSREELCHSLASQGNLLGNQCFIVMRQKFNDALDG